MCLRPSVKRAKLIAFQAGETLMRDDAPSTPFAKAVEITVSVPIQIAEVDSNDRASN